MLTCDACDAFEVFSPKFSRTLSRKYFPGKGRNASHVSHVPPPPRPPTFPHATSIVGRDTGDSRKSLRINERVLPGPFHAGSAGARKPSTLCLPHSPNDLHSIGNPMRHNDLQHDHESPHRPPPPVHRHGGA